VRDHDKENLTTKTQRMRQINMTIVGSSMPHPADAKKLRKGRRQKELACHGMLMVRLAAKPLSRNFPHGV